jgi:hypothetical protein
MILLELRSPWFIIATDCFNAWSKRSFLNFLHVEEVCSDRNAECSSEVLGGLK